MLEPAPLHRDIMHPAPEGSAWWLHAPDGVRLRMAAWPAGRRGTILFFNGRTEYIEKYGMAAREFGERGFAFATMDWRGQGLSDSDGCRPGLCHVDDFSEFQLDIRAACDAMTEIELPRPFFLVAHSMGGAIGLRALQKGVPVNAAMFCAPMWRIYLSRFVRRAAKYLSTTATRLGLSRQFVFGSGRRNYVELSSPGRNRLTSDVAMYTFLRNQLHHRPELTRGDPPMDGYTPRCASAAACWRNRRPVSLPSSCSDQTRRSSTRRQCASSAETGRRRNWNCFRARVMNC